MIILAEIKKNLEKRKVSGMLLTDLSKAFDCIVHDSGMLLTDLSKAFDCIVHDLLIAKLRAYGFDFTALAFVISYLPGRKQRTKIGISFSNWADIILGVPQGSILGPVFLNLYIYIYK